MSRTWLRSVLVLVLPMSVLAGCAKHEALPGAVYAQTVAIYKPAVYDGAMGGQSGEDFGTITSEGVSWFFKTEDSMDAVVAFYEKSLPGARKDASEEEVTFTLVPPGAEADEQVQVIVSQGRIQIHESTKPGKHKDTNCYDKAMDESGLGWLK